MLVIASEMEDRWKGLREGMDDNSSLVEGGSFRVQNSMRGGLW